MGIIVNKIFLIFVMLIFQFSHAGVWEAIDAIKVGDYETGIYNFEKAEKEAEGDAKMAVQHVLAATYQEAPDYMDSDYQKAFDLYIKSSEVYNQYVHAMLGNMYFFGQGTIQNYEEAVKQYNLSLKYSDYDWSLWMLGKMYLHGFGVDQDYEKARDFFERSDSNESGNAQFELGHIYEYGKGVEVDINKAIEYYQNAYEQGDADAKYKIDILTGKINYSDRNLNFERALDYTYGFTVEVDYEKALEYYQIEANKGHPESIYNIGYIISESSPIKRNTDVANYFKRAAELGNVYAQTSLASLYATGKGVEKNNKKSFFWEKKAALSGNISSIKEVAHNYYLGYGTDKNFKKSFEWYQKSAERGDAESFYQLAEMYREGKGVEKDFNKSLELYEKSASLGYDEAQNELATVYFKGEKVLKDYKKSFYWSEKAASQGLADAQNKLGLFYSTGKNVVPVDMDKAFKFFKQAAEQGSEKAATNLGKFYDAGYGVKSDEVEAFIWYKKAADMGSDEGMYNLGRFYASGKSVQKDINKAIEWYKKSADGQFKASQIAMGSIYYYGEKDFNIPKNYKKAADWYYKAAKNDSENKDRYRVETKVTSYGSGFFVTPNHIITNNHVTEDCGSVEIKNKDYTSKVSILDADSTTDLSILVTGDPNESYLHLRDRKPLSTGEQSIALGFPFSSSLGSELKVTSGNIAALTGLNNNIAELQLTSPVQPGNSGGPLMDDNGNVIGVIVSRLERSSEITGNRPAQNVNFAIKSNMAKIFMDLNMVEYRTRSASNKKEISQIVSDSRNSIVKVICHEE